MEEDEAIRTIPLPSQAMKKLAMKVTSVSSTVKTKPVPMRKKGREPPSLGLRELERDQVFVAMRQTKRVVLKELVTNFHPGSKFQKDLHRAYALYGGLSSVVTGNLVAETAMRATPLIHEIRTRALPRRPTPIQSKKEAKEQQDDSAEESWTDFISPVEGGDKKVPDGQLKDLQSHIIPFSELFMGRLLGEGAFGAVFLADWRGETVAVKVLRGAAAFTRAARGAFLAEVALMARLHHRHVVQMMAACLEESRAALVTEYMERGSLYNVLHDEDPPSMEWRLRWAVHVAKGLHYLHKRRVVHRDLKSPNVLIDADGRAKLADFGLSRTQDTLSSLHSQVGTPQWMAPEVIKDSSYTNKADVYSYAMVLYELITCCVPCPPEWNSITVQWKIVMDGWRPGIPDHAPPGVKAVLASCWDSDPKKRPEMEEVVSWMEDIEFQFQGQP